MGVTKSRPYGGLLTQAAILKVTSNGTTTLPVVRGAKTIRELLAFHTRSDTCASCHARFDPVRLALENFDVLGGVQHGQHLAFDRERNTPLSNLFVSMLQHWASSPTHLEAAPVR